MLLVSSTLDVADPRSVRRRRWSTIATAIVIAALACSGCGPGTTVTSSHAIGSFTGRLAGGPAPDPQVPVDCTWLEDTTGHRLEVFWPSGWEEAFHPARILEPSGAVFAWEGDIVRVTFNADAIGGSVCSPGVPVAAETVELIAASSRPPSP
jgi:hypothetical protein